MRTKNLTSVITLGLLLAACSCDKQQGGEVSVTDKIELSVKELTLDAAGTPQTIKVTADHEWGTRVSDKWLRVTPGSSTDREASITISAEPNPLGTPRTSEVRFMAAGARASLSVTQEGGEASADDPIAPEGYKLVWHDEFASGSEPDPTYWTHEVQGAGWVNNELQNYVVGEINGQRVTEVSNGTLKITALKEGGKVYSGRIYAQVGTGWRYGIFEAKIKLPTGKGTWPAFWMMPVNNDFAANPWPKCGEIDIMEEVGYNQNFTSSSIHTKSFNHVMNTQKTAERKTDKADSEFHVYKLEWTKDYIQTYVDDEPLLRFDNDGAGNVDTWPFDKPFYLILNLAWGGAWGGAHGVDEAALPATMEVDYIRVYQAK